MLAAPSGGGKSTVSGALGERLIDAGLQFRVIDPEGDYDSGHGIAVVGDAHQALLTRCNYSNDTRKASRSICCV
ncbi:hypothetical protein PQR02_37035 [Paraburkholderia sediminicola]|uniref:Uncharacterized protein n=1 Tax=Paraburkholderia rhynchosiae TaxID=487049 RepID=A0ACC7NTY5_9BURK